jgi:hypothetical protein
MQPKRALALVVIALAVAATSCRDDAWRAGAQSEARVHAIHLAEVPDAPTLPLQPVARIFAMPRGVEFETAALAASLGARSSRAASLAYGVGSSRADPLAFGARRFALDDLRTDDGIAPEFVGAERDLYTSARRFVPNGMSGRSVDVFIDATASWDVAELVLQQTIAAGFQSMGLGVQSHGAPGVLIYVAPPRAALDRVEAGVMIGLSDESIWIMNSTEDVRSISLAGGRRQALEILRSILLELRAADPARNMWLRPDSVVAWSAVFEVISLISRVARVRGAQSPGRDYLPIAFHLPT